MSVSQTINKTVSLKNDQKKQPKMNHSVSHAHHQQTQGLNHEHFVHEKTTLDTTHILDDEQELMNNATPSTEKKDKDKDIDTDNENENDTAQTADTLEYWQILKKSVIEGERVRLVPYCEHHVKTYNNWLNDPYIQQMTNSEPYSLEQEYEFQKEWNESDTKYIFIILDKTRNAQQPPMAGDINIFIQDEYCGELNVMIAEQQSRRKGLASETLSLVIEWAKYNLEIKRFIAKIQHDNVSSIALFKKLGFQQTDYVDAFKEYTYTLTFEHDHEQQQQQEHEAELDTNRVRTIQHDGDAGGDEADESEGDEWCHHTNHHGQHHLEERQKQCCCHSEASTNFNHNAHCHCHSHHCNQHNVLHLQSDQQCTD